MKKTLSFLPVYLIVFSVCAQQQLPIIDMHAHALPADHQGPPPLGMCVPIYPLPVWDQRQPYGEVFLNMWKNPPCDSPVWSPMTDKALMKETIREMEKLNMYGVLSGTPERVAKWMAAAPGRFYPGILFGLGPDAPTPDELRELHEKGQLAVLGEITNQYAGIAPNDERMEPYWKMAESLDIPVAIHIGPGPPGVIYLGAKGYRARLHSALTMEEVLVQHPHLRVYIMHAGYPMLDDLLALLYAHPQVYVDVAVIVYTQPRAAFYRFLKGIMEAGFGNRVLFGTDAMVWPGVIACAVDVIRDAPFLTHQQKRDIFYNNAARFLRLSDEEIGRHHGKPLMN